MTAAAQLLEHARRCARHGSVTATRAALDRVRRLLELEATQRRKAARPLLRLPRRQE